MMGPNGSAFGVQYVQQSIRFAAELGCPMVDTVDGAFETPGMTREEVFRVTCDNYAQVLPWAEDYGVIVNVEPHGPYTNDIDFMHRLFRHFDSEFLRCNFDTGNTFIAGTRSAGIPEGPAPLRDALPHQGRQPGAGGGGARRGDRHRQFGGLRRRRRQRGQHHALPRVPPRSRLGRRGFDRVQRHRREYAEERGVDARGGGETLRFRNVELGGSVGGGVEPGHGRGVIGGAGPANFLIILADDMGFSDPGCYGGEISTPHLDGLAARGLRFTQFYNTGRCWPTRACIMTGYYAQQIRMDPPQGRLPEWARTLPQMLGPAGYRCYHSGKWHVQGAPLPVADGGFDRSYHVTDHDRHFSPQQGMEDDRPLPPVERDSGHYSTTATADHMIRCLREHRDRHADRPFFGYLAFIAPHFPLHAPEEDIARYRDRYREGWDVLRRERWQRVREQGIFSGGLAEREPEFESRYLKPEYLEQLGPGESRHPVAWEDLTPAQQQFQAMKMAIHAAMVDRMDREIGRVLDQLRAMDAFDNTVIFFLSDNGADSTILIRGDGHDPAAAPGSAASYLCLGPGFACASNSPFRKYKIWTHEGGIATPLIVHWPEGISARGELRRDPGHVIDFVPTLLELAGIDAVLPAGAPPLPGRSLVPAFDREGSVRRDFLFFHHQGNRAIRVGDRKLVSAREDGDAWELYDLSTDRCEARDLAAERPEEVGQLSRLWERCEREFVGQAGLP